MILDLSYSFTGSVWIHPAPGGWHFVSLPKQFSKEIRLHNQHFEEGWGRLNIRASINDISWNTAIWFDTKKATYLLPIKAEIRRKMNIHKDDELTITIFV